MTELINVAHLDDTAITFGLVLTRVSAFLVAGPLQSQGPIPNRFKAALCIAFSLFWMPTEPTPQVEYRLGGLLLTAFGEFAIGYTLGTIVRLIFLTCTIAGSYVAQELGFNLGQVTDPTSGAPSSETVILFETIGVVLFWTSNADHFVWRALGISIKRFEASWDSVLELGSYFTEFFHAAHEIGILVVAPVAAAMWITLVALSLLMRAWPQVTLFSFGMGARILIGLAALLFCIPQIIQGMSNAITSLAYALENATF